MTRDHSSSLHIAIVVDSVHPTFFRFVIADGAGRTIETSRFAYATARGAEVAAQTRLTMLGGVQAVAPGAASSVVEDAPPFPLSAA